MTSKFPFFVTLLLGLAVASAAQAATTMSDVDSAASRFKSSCSSSHSAFMTLRSCNGSQAARFCMDEAEEADSAYSSASSDRSAVENKVSDFADAVEGKEDAKALISKAESVLSSLPSLSSCR